MALEDFAAQLGYVNRPDDGGRSQWYNGDMRLRNGEDGGTLSTLLPWYDRFTTTMDAQGRPVYGTKARAEGQSEVFQGPDGRAYLRVDNSQITDQHREVGGKPSDIIYDPQNGYGIEVGLQERWAQKFQQDDTLEKIANNMPIIMGIIFGGAAAAGALGGAGGVAAGAGEGAAVAGGAGAAGGGTAAAGGAAAGSGASAGLLPSLGFAEAGTTLGGYGAAGGGAFGGLGGTAGLIEAGAAAAGAGGAAGAAGGASGGIGAAQTGSALSAADTAALTQMGTDAGLSGSALQSFVSSGGTLGSTAAGGGGIGAGATGLNYFDLAKKAISTPGVSQLLSGGLQSLGGYLGSRAQADAVGDANNLLWRQYQQNREDLTPYRMAGYGALGGLVDMTTPGKQFDRLRLDPGYDFRLSEGQQAIDSKLRAGGKFYSGTGIKAAADYNHNFASNEFNSAYNRLAALAGTGQSAANTTAQLGQNTAQQAANNTVDIGNARASGYGAIAGGLSGALNSYQNAQQTQQLFDLLSKRS